MEAFVHHTTSRVPGLRHWLENELELVRVMRFHLRHKGVVDLVGEGAAGGVSMWEGGQGKTKSRDVVM